MIVGRSSFRKYYNEIVSFTEAVEKRDSDVGGRPPAPAGRPAGLHVWTVIAHALYSAL